MRKTSLGKNNVKFLIFLLLITISFPKLHLSNNPSFLNCTEEIDSEYYFETIKTSALRWCSLENITTDCNHKYQFNPSIALDASKNIHVVWDTELDYDGSGSDKDIFYKRREDASGTWSKPVVISNGSSISSRNPKVVSDGLETIHLVWQEGSDNYTHKMLNITSNLWSSNEKITENEITPNFDVTIDKNGYVHLVRVNETHMIHIYWNSSSETWSSEQAESIEFQSNYVESPAIIVGCDGVLHVVWSAKKTTESHLKIYYKSKNTTSGIWGNTVQLSEELAPSPESPAIAVDKSNNIYIVWTEECDKGRGIYFKKWKKDVGKWSSSNLIIHHEVAIPPTSEIAVSDTILHLFTSMLYQGPPTNEIAYYQYDHVNNLTILTDALSADTPDCSEDMWPSIAMETSDVFHVVWVDRSHCGYDTNAILYKKSVPIPNAPILNPFVPPNTTTGIVNLTWNNVSGADLYFVYRDNSTIYSTDELLPITNTSFANYTDTLSTVGNWSYVIIAGNATGNSSMSNCEMVEFIATEGNGFVIDPIVLSVFIIVPVASVCAIAIVWYFKKR